eukprot:1136688-Pelagomonas_calceolata.AAC.3
MGYDEQDISIISEAGDQFVSLPAFYGFPCLLEAFRLPSLAFGCQACTHSIISKPPHTQTSKQAKHKAPPAQCGAQPINLHTPALQDRYFTTEPASKRYKTTTPPTHPPASSPDPASSHPPPPSSAPAAGAPAHAPGAGGSEQQANAPEGAAAAAAQAPSGAATATAGGPSATSLKPPSAHAAVGAASTLSCRVDAHFEAILQGEPQRKVQGWLS